MARYLTTATLVALAMFSAPASVEASSTGMLGYCSLAPTYKYGKGSAVMNWVNPPVFTDFYTVRSADTIQPITSIPASDPKSYIPGQWTPIHVRVHDLDRKYIGLVMYATNGALDAATGLTSRAGTQVGEWQVTSNMAFQSPATCKGTAITHSDADLKPLHSVLYFRAPAGTGTVSFHVMIKQGEQGQGNFFYPKFTLTLTEAAVPALPTTLMIESDPKQSCTAACAATTTHKTCDETATAALTTAASITTALNGAAQRQLICRPQIVSGCVAVAPGRQPEDFCAYKSTTCVADGRATGATTCAATSARTDLTRFCMCTKTAVATTAPTTAATTAPTTAATTAPTTKATTAPTTAATTAPTTKATAAPTSAATTAPTTKATTAPTSSTTTGPTTKATAGPTSATTAGPTSATTTGPTTKATAGPTSSATTAPTTKATSAPSGAATSAPTTEATAAPTDAATEAPTDAPTSGPADSSSGDMSSTGKPVGLGSTGLNAASPRTVQSLFSTLLTMLVAVFLSGSRRASMLMAAVMTLYLAVSIPSAAAHNYVTSPSRALVASVLKPCQARVSPFPHVQVVPGQAFPQEWVNGHGDSRSKTFYWVLVKADDFEFLRNINDTMLDDYINMAPKTNGNGVTWYNGTATLGSKWVKRHLSSKGNIPNMMVSKYFDHQAPSTETNFIVRDASLIEKSIWGPRDQTQVAQWVYLANATTRDARVAYKSAKYPEIISVHRFYNIFDEHSPYAGQPNVANFEIPAESTPGDYIYHFKWGGYRDCVDVNVMANTTAMPSVTLPWGKLNAVALAEANGVAPFVKLDHCEFLFVHNPTTQCRIVPRTATGALNVSQCIADCAANGGCRGVQLARAKNPAAVRIDYAPAIPFFAWNDTAMDANGNRMRPQWPCEFHSINERDNAGCANKFPTLINNKANPLATCNADVLKPQLKDDDYVCYGLTPYRNQDLQAAEDFMTAEDPEDPKFYSTCWQRIDPGGFLDSPRPPPITPHFAVGDKCLSCAFRSSVPQLDLNSAPRWEASLTDTCRNCEEPAL